MAAPARRSPRRATARPAPSPDTAPPADTAPPPAARSGKPAMRHFASTRDPEPEPTLDFSVEFVRDGVSEVHEFTAALRVGFSDTVALLTGADDEAKVLPHLDRMIRRALLNTDGTPQRWRPSFEGKEFIAPDGERHPAVHLDRYTSFDAGSSRRRWAHLMDVDEEIQVEHEQVVAVFEYITSEAADRPTQRSSR